MFTVLLRPENAQAARVTSITDSHHATAPGGRDTETQEDRAAVASLRRARADQPSAHALNTGVGTRIAATPLL